MRVIGYARVSTAQQADSGLSIDDQRARLAAWCQAHGHELVEVVTDAGISGSLPFARRPGGEKVLRLISEGKAELVAFTKLDRVSRSLRDLLETLEHVGAFASLAESIDTSTPAGRLMLHMLGALAEFEREQTRERTVAAFAFAKADMRTGFANGAARMRKRLPGAPPFGYRRVMSADGAPMVEPDPVQQEALATLRQLREEGCSTRTIAAEIRLRHGFEVSHKTVARVLKGDEHVSS